MVAVAVFLLVGGAGQKVGAWEYALLDDFHFSARKELSGERKYQVDNYYAMDVYRLFGTMDFHSSFLITNDLNLLDAEAIQLTLAYVSLERLKGHLHIDAGRRFFSRGFDAFVGDGVLARYQYGKSLQFSAHFAFPFDAENQAIKDEPMHVYGFSVDLLPPKEGMRVPCKVSAQLERREWSDAEGLDQTLLGLEAGAELNWPVENDVYSDLEYEAENSRFRRVRLGTQFFLSPFLTINVEGERYEAETRKLQEQFREFLQDAIMSYFARSELWSGSVALAYSLPKNRDLSITYSGQRYVRRSGEIAYGNGVDLFMTFLSVPSLSASLGGGYSGRIAGGDYVHLGILRTNASLSPLVRVNVLCESGVLNNREWKDVFVLHVRGGLEYRPRPNLEVSVLFEENKNPYFGSDLRGMTFVRYFWGRREGK